MLLAKATVKATKNSEASLVAYSEPKSAAAEAYNPPYAVLPIVFVIECP